MKQPLRIGLAVALGALACVLCLAYGSRVKAAAAAERDDALERYGGEIVEVVVATRALEPGEEATATNCEVREWLVDLCPEDVVTSLDEVAGSTLTSPVSAGTPLTQTAYRTGASAVSIPSGHVAITLPQTDKLGVAQNVAVGSTLAAYVIEDETCRLLTADVLVIATDSTSSTSTYLTFALLPEDVAAFATAHSANTLRLVQPADDVLTLDAGAAPASVAPVEANAVEAVAVEDSAVGAATTSDTSSVASTTAADAASTAQSSRDSQTDGTATASSATTQEGGTSS